MDERVLEKRRALFLIGCIGARLWLSYIVKESQWLAEIVIVIGLGFWTIYWFNLRKTGLEVFGDVIWWNNLRPIHGTLYLTAGLMLLSNKYKKYAWMFILVDTMIGLYAFVEYHNKLKVKLL
jgi:hypothetical protein